MSVCRLNLQKQGDVNLYSVKAKENNITTEVLLKYVIWSNDGVLNFINGE